MKLVEQAKPGYCTVTIQCVMCGVHLNHHYVDTDSTQQERMQFMLQSIHDISHCAFLTPMCDNCRNKEGGNYD